VSKFLSPSGLHRTYLDTSITTGHIYLRQAKANEDSTTHAERCQLLKPNKLGTNLLEETLQTHQLRVAQQANVENTPLSLLPNQQLSCPHTPSRPLLK
jgi:hypothetical protein